MSTQNNDLLPPSSFFAYLSSPTLLCPTSIAFNSLLVLYMHLLVLQLPYPLWSFLLLAVVQHCSLYSTSQGIH